ncbi:MAG: class I SAM-dependent methyltransferase [Pseudomonadota bacterium]
MSNGEWIISGVDRAWAESFLAEHAPWRMLLQFDSGPRSDQYETFQPFNAYPLRKLMTALEHVSLPDAPSVLDVGFNLGYNSLHLAQNIDARPVGIDVRKSHLAVATALADKMGVEATFLMESAEEFVRPDAFDLALHLGTLYHLPNPLRSLELTCKSLRKGGWIVLETIKCSHSDPAYCKWIWGFNGDKTNFWALGEQCISDMLTRCGLSRINKYSDIEIPAYRGLGMTRASWVAQKT